MSSRRAVNLTEKLATFFEHYWPRTVSQFNGHDVMVAKLKGSFHWHVHDDTDDFFLVLQGRLTMQLPDEDVPVNYSLCPGVWSIGQSSKTAKYTSSSSKRRARLTWGTRLRRLRAPLSRAATRPVSRD
jgi:hypothetical protein